MTENAWKKVWAVACPGVMPGCGRPAGQACKGQRGNLPPGQTHRVRVRAFLESIGHNIEN